MVIVHLFTQRWHNFSDFFLKNRDIYWESSTLKVMGQVQQSATDVVVYAPE